MKQVIKALTMAIALAPSVGFCNGAPVHDPMTFAEVVKVLQETKKHIEETRKVHNEISQTKAILGNFTEDGLSLKNSLLNWETYYDKIDDLDADTFSGFKWLGVDKLHPENYASDTFGYATSFNSKKAFDDVKHQMLDDEQHPEEMRYRRQEFAHNSMAASVVIANESKNSVAGTKKKLTDAMAKSVGSSDLLNTMKAQNELLAILATQSTQQTEMMAQQLELLSSFFVSFQGTGKLSDPSKKTNVKKPWE